MTQNKAILAHLKKGNSITQKEAYEKFNCFRLSARINDLRVDNNIKTTNVSFKNKEGYVVTYASYKLL